MSSLNSVAFSGHLSRDPELRATPSGTSVLEIGLCVNDRVKDQSTGEWSDRPNFLDVSVFGRMGDSLANLLSKGDKIAMSGRVRWSSWETQDGHKRSRVTFVADRVELMQQRQGSAAQAPDQSYPPPMPAGNPTTYDGGDDDIPF